MMQNPRGEGAKRKEELPIGSSSLCVRSSFFTVVLSAVMFSTAMLPIMMMSAFHIGIIYQFSGQQRVNRVIRIAGRARIQTDAGFCKSGSGSSADSSADQRVHTVLR